MDDLPPIPAQTKLREVLIRSENRPNYIVAAKAKISPVRLSEYSLGKRPIPAHHLMALCEVLHCQPDDILGEMTI